jgi:kynureninase
LGLQPLAAAPAISAELDAWGRQGVDAWFDPERPWFTYTDRLREPMARLVGARASEVAILNALTVNIHLLLASFFRPDGRRRRILADGPLFPSDRHALSSHLAWRGLDPVRDLLVVESPDAIEQAIRRQGDEIALVFLAGVNFATGVTLPIAGLTKVGHAVGAVVGWDLAHAVGNVELELHDADVDFAAWCTYKYLNGGPGAPGAVFVHERHGQNPATPRLGGWWGIQADHRFDMSDTFAPAAGAGGWELSTPSPLTLAPLAASLAIFDEVGMPALRERSVRLTGYLAKLLAELPVEVITPAVPTGRGAQLSLRFDNAEEVLAALAARGVTADYRAPDIVRLAPTPLYNTFHELWRFAATLTEVLAGPVERHSGAPLDR